MEISGLTTSSRLRATQKADDKEDDDNDANHIENAVHVNLQSGCVIVNNEHRDR
jgi:hypothetical protein